MGCSGVSASVFPAVLRNGLFSDHTQEYCADSSAHHNHQPIRGTLSLTLLAPFCICCLFYAPSFSPLCASRPWAAYLVMSVLVLIASFFDIYWQLGIVGALIVYIIRLPVHLFARWTYQKTDNIWTPMFALVGFNLLTSLATILLTAPFSFALT